MKLLGFALITTVVATILLQSTVNGCWKEIFGDTRSTKYGAENLNPGEKDVGDDMWERQERESGNDTLAVRDDTNITQRSEEREIGNDTLAVRDDTNITQRSEEREIGNDTLDLRDATNITRSDE